MIALTLSLSSCGNSIPVESHWSVETLYSNGNAVAIPAGHNPGISFLKDNKIAGETGCNRFFGDFKANGEEISFGNMGSTRMMCPEMAFENAFLNVINETAQYTLTDKSLALKDKDGNIIAILKKIEPTAVEN